MIGQTITHNKTLEGATEHESSSDSCLGNFITTSNPPVRGLVRVVEKAEPLRVQ
jgi:hypothetical protein